MEAINSYTKVYALNQPSLTVAKVLVEFEDLLVAVGFIRVHRSHLINPAYVVQKSSEGYLTLIDQLEIKIPRRKKKSIDWLLASQCTSNF